MKNSISVDDLYVISDLHLGGEPGFQIFGSTRELVWLIEDLAARPEDRKVALLVNGDVVDFLAERDPEYFDAAGATDRLDRILVKDKNFSPILKALRAFVRTPNRRLVVNLGNHDLEIALPWVERHFVNLIAQDDAAACGRILMLTQGSGASFKIGSTRIYCAHGNEVDSWNVTDHEKIRKIGRDILQGQASEPWIPNAGTQLVIDAMNGIKKQYPFVDLLKPETKGVIPILAAIKPSLAAQLENAPSVVARRTTDSTRMRAGMLSGDEAPEQDERTSIAPLSEAVSKLNTEAMAKRMLAEADAGFKKNQSPMDRLSNDIQGKKLGLVDAIFTAVRGGSKSEILRSGLDYLAKDQSFDTSHKDEAFFLFDKRIGSNADIIVTGHTHLERAIRRERSSGYYFNTGTWARLIKIETSRLNDQAAFDQMIQAIEAGTMAALEKVPDLIKRNNTVLQIKHGNKNVESQLMHVTPNGGAFQLFPVPNTQFLTS